MSRFRLDGRVAIVTGASSGIGEHSARVLAAAGASLVLVARRRDRLETLAAALPEGLAVAADLSRPEEADRVVAETEATYGRLDVLVNAAGATVTAPAMKESVAEFARVLEVNLVAPYSLSRAALPMMRRSPGAAVVNFSSVVARISEPSLPEAGYTASKGGLGSLTRELAVQWARHGVRVNAIAPGWFPTEMTEELTGDSERSAEFVPRRIPMGRYGSLAELDGPLLLLASDAGSYMTGQTIVVDGGASLI